ncbi:MAG: hypothetical protein A3H57_02275 [Candidatus Taylorbacteria bacterium RIFCSPLOWO2_02_FULL_43_11]|uniref:Uncharacterized protein n=1 Tax=Candidatus Taylorbacteria bacterium RIFCSPHIGHO2_02_FULL_43_32b TaxID=1802306 RepID=A0A1G2MKR8_9BACT|nr:MAG: hypothetical protein A2743_02260 [Candidatus Taylorbacteria bacterium RIFCSPHIGHO2_01_FULL_43_47]OHA24463.1 MAG: hypothetical protein A3C72_04465 [Candidatus Taylorbacteria bacterium RIFCSPHIGHO2_02_FULL_43_32b]OHA35363.1 MAG: hypothetical protein A3H57_02275 [Candidatus Taylorbacteria bacterium RIFCSPLOWO2_02_FULL_43_11]
MAKNIIVNNQFNIQPSDINIGPDFEHFFDAFGNMETEVSAYYVVRLCQKKGGWFPFSQAEIEEVYQASGHQDGFIFNRLVDPQAVLAKPAEELEKMATHATRCRGMNPIVASISYAMSHGRPETIKLGGGWIVRDTEGRYHVTDEFVVRCFQSSPARSKAGLSTIS